MSTNSAKNAPRVADLRFASRSGSCRCPLPARPPIVATGPPRRRHAARADGPPTRPGVLSVCLTIWERKRAHPGRQPALSPGVPATVRRDRHALGGAHGARPRRRPPRPDRRPARRPAADRTLVGAAGDRRPRRRDPVGRRRPERRRGRDDQRELGLRLPDGRARVGVVLRGPAAPAASPRRRRSSPPAATGGSPDGATRGPAPPPRWTGSSTRCATASGLPRRAGPTRSRRSPGGRRSRAATCTSTSRASGAACTSRPPGPGRRCSACTPRAPTRASSATCWRTRGSPTTTGLSRSTCRGTAAPTRPTTGRTGATRSPPRATPRPSWP